MSIKAEAKSTPRYCIGGVLFGPRLMSQGGEIPNAICSYSIRDFGGQNVSYLYNIVPEEGTIQVIRRVIDIEILSEENTTMENP